MLAFLLLATVQGPVLRPDHDLAAYLALAARYRAERAAALREVLGWRTPEIDAALAGLRRREDDLRTSPAAASDVDFRLVESAVLLHAEAGLLALAARFPVDAEWHLATSVDLFQWSRRAARRLVDRLPRRDYFLALGATSLAVGVPATARPFAEEATRAAPFDAEVHLVLGCVLAGVADQHVLAHADGDAARAREDAERAFRDALALDRDLPEARLRLGKLLLDVRRTLEAEPLLLEVERKTGEPRQRYLALLFLGRVAERRGQADEAVRKYRRALECWPQSQAARLALAHALEAPLSPLVSRTLVGATLADSLRESRSPDPWWLYPFGPPGLAQTHIERLWDGVLRP